MKEIIQKMREQAHEIGVKRYREWWDSLTPDQQKAQRRGILDAEIGEAEVIGEYKPGVIELDPAHPPTPYAVQMQLMLLGVFASIEELASQTREELEIAALWAATAMLSASDNDVVISPRPEWLAGRDRAQIDELIKADIEKHGGEDHVSRIYGDEWYVDTTKSHIVDLQVSAPLRSYTPAPPWAQKLRAIADAILSIAPDELSEEGIWLHDWLDAGAPMFDPAKPAHDSLDTSVDEDISTEIQDGNDSRSDTRSALNIWNVDRPDDVDSGSTSS